VKRITRPRIVASDPRAYRARNDLSNLVWLFADEPATREALGEVASAVGIDLDHYGSVTFDELGARITPELATILFQRLRRRYDEVLDDRLLADRSSRPIVQPGRPSIRVDDEASAPSDAPSWEAFERDVDAEMEKLLATARYSLRLAAQEGEKTRHLQRSAQSLAQAADWNALLRADGRSASQQTIAELQSLRGRLDELIDRRLQGLRASSTSFA
jgi:hypothetical protein